VLTAIEFNHQHALDADEVDHVAIDLVLATELAAIQLAVPQAIPERPFGVGHAKTQFTRPVHVQAFHP
jgi:hypothetical protein